MYQLSYSSSPRKRSLTSSSSSSTDIDFTPKKSKLEQCTTLRIPEKPCCSQDCLNHFNSQQNQKYATAFHKLKIEDKYDFLIKVLNHSSHNSEIAHHKWTFIVNQVSVCKTAFMQLYQVTDYMFYNAVHYVQTETIPVHGNIRNQNASPASAHLIKSWLHVTALKFGEIYPHLPHLIFLPNYFTKKFMLDECIDSIKSDPLYDRDVSQSSLYNYFHLHCSHFRFPRRLNMGVCNTCVELDNQRLTVQNVVEKEAFSVKKHEHIQHVIQERSEYSNRKQLAFNSNTNHLIIDGMNKFYFPHSPHHAKAITTAHRIGFHTIGIINHTYKKRFLYLLPNFFNSGSNLTIIVLLNHLTEILNDNSLQRARILHVQYDNCWRDNKNKFVLAFAALLIEWNIYDEVYFSSLIPGHTHEDVDQMFSNFYTHYYKCPLHSLLDFNDWIDHAYPGVETRPSIRFLNIPYNYSSWINDSLIDINGISSARFFHFRKYSEYNDEPRFVYKESSNDVWKGLANGNDEPIIILKHFPTLEEFLENCDTIGPNKAEFDTIKKDFSKIKIYIPPEHVTWINNFLTSPNPNVDFEISLPTLPNNMDLSNLFSSSLYTSHSARITSSISEQTTFFSKDTINEDTFLVTNMNFKTIQKFCLIKVTKVEEKYIMGIPYKYDETNKKYTERKKKYTLGIPYSMIIYANFTLKKGNKLSVEVKDALKRQNYL